MSRDNSKKIGAIEQWERRFAIETSAAAMRSIAGLSKGHRAGRAGIKPWCAMICRPRGRRYMRRSQALSGTNKRSDDMAPFKQTTIPAHFKDPAFIGRPTEYREHYCDMVVEFMAQGYSLTAFAGSIRVAVDTVYEWIKRHSAFSDAVARARGARVTALESKLLRSRKGAETTAAIFALRNAAPEEWRDIRHVEHDHNHKLEALTDAQLYAIAAQKAHGDGTVIEGEFVRSEETETR